MVEFQLGKFNLQWKGKVRSKSPRGASLYREKLPPLVSDWSVLMKMRAPNLHSLVGPKNTVLIDWNGAIHSDWSVKRLMRI